MPELVNLEKIVNYVYESELELEPEETRESKRNSCYENVRSQLTLILKNIEFDVDLIKDMEHGYANKGSFVIPKKDGGFIEWLISIFKEDSGKALKAGDFANCNRDDLKKLIDGLIQIITDLGVDKEIVELQKDIMEQKTMIYISYECKEMWQRMYDSFYSVSNLMEIAGSFVSYQDQKAFWEKWKNDFISFTKKKESEYLELERNSKELVLKDAPRLSPEELEFSKRSQDIISALSDNEEYVTLKDEYEELFLRPEKKTASLLKKTEKRKKEIIKRLYEIFDSEVAKLPIDVDAMSDLEKYMCVCDGHFRLFYVKEEKQMALIVDDKYFQMERMLQNRHPFDDEDEVGDIYILHL